MKAKIQKAMRDNLICDRKEAEAAIEFVRSLLELDIEDTEANEPYATYSIHEMKVAVSRVSNLDDLLERHL